MNGKLERSLPTMLLVDELSKGADFYSYEQLSAIVGGDVRGEYRCALSSARHIVETERSLHYRTVRKEGLRLMRAEEAAVVGMCGVVSMHRTAKRTLRHMACIEVGELDNAEKVKFNATASALGVMAHFTQPKSVAMLEKAVAKTQERLSLTETLKEFSPKKE